MEYTIVLIIWSGTILGLLFLIGIAAKSINVGDGPGGKKEPGTRRVEREGSHPRSR